MATFTKHTKLAVLLITPQLLVTVLFFLWPAGGAVFQSLFFSDAFGLQKSFAGIQNYIDLLASPDYIHAVAVTLFMAFFITFFTLASGLVLAVLVHGCTKSRTIYKSLLLWPYAVAPAVAAILWRFLCHPTLGWLTQWLQSIGLDFNYLVNAKQAMFVIIIAATWQQFSYNFLFFFAALKLIPRNLSEAAMLDGASSWRRFWQITVPLLSPTIFFLLIMNLIYSFFDTFGIIQIVSNGGPEASTTTLIYKVYKDGFVGMDPGSSSAQSVILMLLVIGLTIVQFKYLEKKVHYQ